MTTENTPQPAPTHPVGHNPLNDKSLEVKEVPEVLDFLRENGVAILIGAGVAAAIFLGWSLYRNFKTSQRDAAAVELFRAQTPEQVQQIINQYPKTPAAPLAQLMLAGQAFDQGQYEMAQNLFTQFLGKFPGHDLRDNAELGILQCQEASGRYAEALEGYTRFVAAHPGHFLEPAALFGKARCLELLGRSDEALAMYNDFIAGRPEDDRWRGRAEAAIAYLKKDQRARARGESPDVPGSVSVPAFSFPALQPAAQSLPAPTTP